MNQTESRPARRRLQVSGSWLPRPPRLLDLFLVLAVFSYNLPLTTAHLQGSGPRFGAGIVVSVCLCAPYLARHRYPLAVFAIIVLVGWAQLLRGIGPMAALRGWW